MPQNEGDLGHSSGFNGLQIVKVFELELSNMEGTPSYGLTHQLTIGSEIGNIVIADPSVSPRHATFVLQHDVVSVIDHGSVSGTFVNGSKIPPGKYIILEESDVIGIGDLEVRIRARNESAPEEEIPEVPEEEGPEQKDVEEEAEEDESFDEGTQEEDDDDAGISQGKKILAARAARKGKKKFTFGLVPVKAANALVRVAAVVCDLLLSYIVLTIFMPFDDFRAFLDFVPAQMAELLGVEWGLFWQGIVEEYQFLSVMMEDIYGFLSGTLQLGPMLLIFILIRLITTLIFGVSLSELLLAVRPGGNKIWARLGGAIRVIIGIFTGPLLVFDVPAIVSRRTFKEFITFTYIFISSKVLAVLGTFLTLPVLLALALAAPLFQGLEVPEPVMVNDRLEQRVRAAVPPAAQGGEVSTPDSAMASSFLGLELTFSPDAVAIMPDFKFQGVQKKLNFKSQVIFYQRELQRPVRLELLKNFDMKQLLGIGMKGNYFLMEKFPEIYSYVYQAESAPSLKAPSDARAHAKFASEVMAFTKSALELGLENALDTMQTLTPLLKGPVDYKAALLGLLEYKDFDQMGFIKLGNVIFMKVSYIKQRPFDLIIPLVMGEGRVFRVEFDSKENLAALSSKFYKYTLLKSDWLETRQAEPTETMTPFQVIDVFSALSPKNKTIPLDKAQALYGYYFERSAEVLKRGDPVETELWKKAAESAHQVIENLEEKKDLQEGEEDPVQKLKQNFRDLKDAVDTANMEYFAPSETITI